MRGIPDEVTKMDISLGFREVFAKQKFGWDLQGGISKSLLSVFSARKKAEGSVKFSLIIIRPKGCKCAEHDLGASYLILKYLEKEL